ncbi:YadA C-terminal domain-containing protein [Ferrimonas senticii]|uniref:YadA C-terminal domain-containing protein n=1 Tax=Ferrimonas senticii TaxID=394566 RepID=UPI000686DF7A|nr:YadA C-terminal domain-containing protein [Ferrimonas senticii]
MLKLKKLVILCSMMGFASLANAIEVTLPEGWTAVASPIKGKVIVYDASGKEHSHHAIKDDMVINNTVGAPVVKVTGAGNNFDKIHAEASGWNEQFNNAYFEEQKELFDGRPEGTPEYDAGDRPHPGGQPSLPDFNNPSEEQVPDFTNPSEGNGGDTAYDPDAEVPELENPSAGEGFGDAIQGAHDKADANAAALDAYKGDQAKVNAAQDEAIFSNAMAIENLQREMDKIDERVDGLAAGMHAVANARPQLSYVGQTAIGAGVGFAGASEAVAVGVAHSFTKNLSMSATFNVTTGGTSDVSGGAGIQYSF